MPRILLVNDTEKPIGELRDALLGAGHEVLEEVVAIGALLKAVESQQPDVVILDIDSPSRDTLEQLALMHEHAPRPVVMFSADGNEQLIRAAVGAGVTAYVVDGLSPTRLAPIIQVALARFEHQSHIRRRLDEVQQQLLDRKLIDRAKGLLMEKRGMAEADAYAALRQQAMKNGTKLVDVARQIIAMADLLG
ncbi:MULTISPECIES: ANTAR domain-containing protein [unclassified Lysobacter]|uniref:ANTAR domain-containing response regulator n=1 Tax=unclassified Lysobacter TaxID=2635362 RepID=UPI001BE76909|nr:MULTISPECIES: ANTAR domain-containing protein [unclassified Lysobacter]MBT2744815.1 ANTAR domain-containing protein [Lysobacter sp. ISL-42]MBT2752192.1 ANTAR domain-containing protein [Lysobacter sp. ISL-50]MBT2778689.1 ANTAR domain-containing protein [Lysobacter sp. ISL-54]MBT2780380.1 ANTAR domain-containing protein [Lysobacter sp. ISL-52]